MKKILLKFALALALIGAMVTFSCEKIEPCESNRTGDVTFHDNAPSYVWDGCYIEVDWYNGSYNSGTFYGTKSYYDKAAGRADVYMEWEDANYYYYDTGYINVIQCGHVDGYLWSKKKSAVVSEFMVERSGQILKSEVISIEEFRKNIKSK